MKKGDRVLIHDGSYSYAEENGVSGHIFGTTLIADGEYEVLETGSYPNKTTQSIVGGHKEVNNLKLRCVKNPDKIVYTQTCFCSVIKPKEA